MATIYLDRWNHPLRKLSARGTRAGSTARTEVEGVWMEHFSDSRQPTGIETGSSGDHGQLGLDKVQASTADTYLSQK